MKIGTLESSEYFVGWQEDKDKHFFIDFKLLGFVWPSHMEKNKVGIIESSNMWSVIWLHFFPIKGDVMGKVIFANTDKLQFFVKGKWKQVMDFKLIKNLYSLMICYSRFPMRVFTWIWILTFMARIHGSHLGGPSSIPVMGKYFSIQMIESLNYSTHFAVTKVILIIYYLYESCDHEALHGIWKKCQ